MSHPLFGPEIRLMLGENDTAGMETFCETLHPATIAEALTDEFSVDETWSFLQHTSIQHQAEIFDYLPFEFQVKLIEGTGRPHMARLIEKMSHDDRADLLRRVKPQLAEELLRLVDEADRRDIAKLIRYEENTAGALMTTEYAWLPEHITVTEALDRLRLQAPDRETIYYVYVLGDQRKLLGIVSLRELILAPRSALIRDVMEEELVAVRATDDREKVAQEMARYDLLAIPVVDDEAGLVGIVTHDDVMDVVVEEATEDVYRMGAVAPMAEHYLEASFATVWRKRAFWLACLFLAELFTFTAMSHFEDAMAEVVVLGLFVPLCLSTGGNSGSQAATLIIRAIALGQVTLANWFQVIRHELFMGLALGLTLGSIGFFRAALTPDDVRGGTQERAEQFSLRVPSGVELAEKPGRVVELPPGSFELLPTKILQVTLPAQGEFQKVESGDPRYQIYTFPASSKIRYRPVGRWDLSLVIALAVAGICLWGTVVGSMLPIIFKRIGVDPGIASSPFVATFVDVTGIVIYFSIAKLCLPELSGVA